VGNLPLDGPSWSSQFQAYGWPADRVGFEILHRRADHGYFEALGIPLVRGRHLEPTDRGEAPFVVVINETFAREHFPGEDPIGQRIAYDRAASDSSTWYEIVGIVGDQSQVSPSRPARAEVFESRSQDWGRSNWVVLRTTLPPLDVVPAVREALREMDPLIPISQVRPLREVWRSSMAREELVLALLGGFSALALLLASVGVYAVTAQSARRRTREIGIRIALGAVRGDVARLVLRQGLGAVVAGLVLGVGGALLATRALDSLLFGVTPTDPGTLASVALLLFLVGAVACWIPARWATRVDPSRSLRIE
jgi:predicted permease